MQSNRAEIHLISTYDVPSDEDYAFNFMGYWYVGFIFDEIALVTKTCSFKNVVLIKIDVQVALYISTAKSHDHKGKILSLLLPLGNI